MDVEHHVRVDDLDRAVLSTVTGDTAIIQEVQVAEPCVEFSRFMVGETTAKAGGLKEPMQLLRGGMRGFYLGLADPVTLLRGDALLVCR